MSKLQLVQETVQQIATAISSVLNIECMILDDRLRIIAGTGKYYQQIGAFEAEAFLSQDYLYKYLLKKGGTYVVDDIFDPLYGPELYGETGEICCVIPYKTGSIGIISLVSFDDKQYDALIGNRESICGYLQHMANLLSSFIANTESYSKIQEQARLFSEIVNSSPHCIITTDSSGCIRAFNDKARNYLQNGQSQFWGILGKKIDFFWENAWELLTNSGENFKNKEFFFNNRAVHVIISLQIIYNNDSIEQAVVFFDDVVEAKQSAFNILSEGRGATDVIVGKSPQIEQLKNMVPNIAASNSTVLITGESGTGKEMFANAIHYSSDRKEAPLVTINCGAIPESLIESELFGYEKGAFTGAAAEGHVGKFEKGNGGTVFVDEIGELPLPMQSKLLHVIQRREFERVGGNKTISVDVRIIAASNRNLVQMVKDGTFREDLYYRLNVIPLHIPPLREHPSDISLLANHFLTVYSKKLNKPIQAFSDEAMSRLLSHDWPGNARELENAIEYSVNMAAGNIITISDLTPALQDINSGFHKKMETDGLKQNVKFFENQLLIQGLKEVELGLLTKEELARKMGISKSSLYRKINRLK